MSDGIGLLCLSVVIILLMVLFWGEPDTFDLILDRIQMELRNG